MTRLEGLYAITPDWPDTALLLASTEAVLAGGCRLLQYRNKTAHPGRRAEQAEALRVLTRRHDALLIVNDDLELAIAVAADGVHLGQDDGDPQAARRRLGPSGIVGVSCYQSLDAARRAHAAGADYLAFGSFFASATKPRAGRATPDLIAAARAELALPVVAIGGITPENAKMLVAAGADMLAVITALYNVADPLRASQEFTQLFARKLAS